MTPEITTLIAGLGGALIGFMASIITIWISKHYEYEKSREILILDAAIKNWEGAKEAWLKNGGELMPLDDFIAHQSRIIPLLLRKSISKTEVEEAMKESGQLRLILEEVSKKNDIAYTRTLGEINQESRKINFLFNFINC